MMRGVSLQRIVFRARDEIEVALSLVGEPEKGERTVPYIAAVHPQGFRGNSNHKRHYYVFRVADSPRNWASAAPPLRKRKGSRGSIQTRERIVDGCRRQIHDRDKNFCSRWIRFNFDNALPALSFYRDGSSGKTTMRSPRTEPSQSSLAT